MKRLSVIAAILLNLIVMSARAAEHTAPPAPVASNSLHIPDTGQEQRRPESGWCGEAAIQMALSHYGAYISQKTINRAGKPEHPDLYARDIPVAMRNVGLEFSPFKGNSQEDFQKWIRSQLAADHPVLLGVKIYPTAHPEWGLDHFVLAAGCTDEALTLNTTWGRQETKTFARLSTEDKGLSLANRFSSHYGYAITGLRSDSTQIGATPTRITIHRDGDAKVDLHVTMKSLDHGKRYRLVRFTDLATAAQAGAHGDFVRSFVADGAKEDVVERVGIDDTRVYRCFPSSN